MAAETESIYQLVPDDPVPLPKPARHVSKHPGTQPASCTTFVPTNSVIPRMANVAGTGQSSNTTLKRSAADYGPPTSASLPDPKDYMRAKIKNKCVATLRQVKELDPERLKISDERLQERMQRKAATTRADERPIMNLVSKKNFLVTNAVDNILMPIKRPAEEFRTDFLKKSDYGKIPEYLPKVKARMEEEYEHIRDLQSMQQDTEMRPLPEEEKTELIKGLKNKWEQINKQYQLGTHMTVLDTRGMIRRKEHYEAALTKIEKDINVLGRKHLLVDPMS